MGGLPLRGGDRLSSGPGDVARPRFLPLLAALGLLVATVAYGAPLVTTGDPFWPLPADTDPDLIVIHWEGRRTEIARADPRHEPLRRGVNAALSSLDGIEYRYGLGPDDFAKLRSSGHALEAYYEQRARPHGAHAIGDFTRLLVSFDGEEFARGLIFVGIESGYRSGPLRSRELPPLRELTERSR